jgi:hypothetical protein
VSAPATPPPARPRLFVLVRDVDPTGVSGTGIVAEGVIWWNGTACLCWYGRYPAVTVWADGIAGIEAVHGHDGATRVHYLDDPTGAPTPAPGLGRSR